jgi:ribosomal protein L37AE/L43A
MDSSEAQRRDCVCPRCGGAAAYAVDGSIYDAHCPQCGWEEGGTVYTGPLEIDDQRIEVVIHWRTGRVTMAELLIARRLLPSLRGGAIADLLAHCRAGPELRVGTLSWWEAVKLKQRASQDGLQVEFRPGV